MPIKPRPRKRSWTLSELEPDTRYMLWFDEDEWRWQATPLLPTHVVLD